jgi:hypothetical protein
MDIEANGLKKIRDLLGLLLAVRGRLAVTDLL